MKKILVVMILSLSFSTMFAQSVNRGVRNITSDLMDLTGQIAITQQGKYVTISYSGGEAVSYDILVNDYDVINDYAYARWDSIMNCYQFDLIELGPISYYDQYYTSHYFFKVTVCADGYKSISDSTDISYFITPDFPPPSIDSWLTPVSLVIYVYGWSTGAHQLSINGVWVDSYSNGEQVYYEAERLDEDYTVHVYAEYKTPMMAEWISYSKTLVVPAILYGDLDGDETLSVNDVTWLIDILLGYVYDYYNNADVNRDGTITISDVTLLIDKLLQ